MKHLAQIRKEIKGKTWHFKLLSDKVFNKIHNPNDEGNTGMTVFSKYEVHFSKSEWDLVDIRHELFHVYFHMSNTGSAGLDSSQTEETMCEIFGNHALEMIMIADNIAECFLNYDKE